MNLQGYIFYKMWIYMQIILWHPIIKPIFLQYKDLCFFFQFILDPRLLFIHRGHPISDIPRSRHPGAIKMPASMVHAYNTHPKVCFSLSIQYFGQSNLHINCGRISLPPIWLMGVLECKIQMAKYSTKQIFSVLI